MISTKQGKLTYQTLQILFPNTADVIIRTDLIFQKFTDQQAGGHILRQNHLKINYP